MDKQSNLIGKKTDSEPVYDANDKYIKTKTKICRDNVNTNFQGKEIPKEYKSIKLPSLIMLDSVVIADKKYYPKHFWCKYEIKIIKRKILLMMILTQFYLMNLTMNLIMDLIMNLKLILVMNLTMILIMNLVMNLAMNLTMNLKNLLESLLKGPLKKSDS